MAALRLGVLLALIAVSIQQGYYGNGRYGIGGFGRFPVGLQAPAGVPGPGFAGVGYGPQMGYDPFFSNIQRTNIYAYNLGYDQSSAAGGNCVNGLRMRDGRCQCAPGFKGADCGVPTADRALNAEPGVICQQTPGDPSATAARQARADSEGPLGGMMLQLETLMGSGGNPTPGGIPTGPGFGNQFSGGILTGPGFGNQFCPSVPNRGPMAPVHLKSALTDYGYVVCSENQLCYNKACPACTMFNPKTGICDNVPDAAMRGLPNCHVVAGETPYELKQQWYVAVLTNPKMSNEAGPGGVPGGAIGNAFFGRGPGMGIGGPFRGNAPVIGRGPVMG